MISPDRQSWKCFGCAAGGDIFTFLERYENLEFGEALKVLAEKAGVELKRLSPQEYKFVGLLYDANTAARDFFRSELLRAPVAAAYLKERGLAPETIEEFELGYAPDKPDALTTHLINAGFAPEDLVRAGVTIKTERGRNLDRFRGRIMFPIQNHLGKAVGFTGRILPQFDTGDAGDPPAHSGFTAAKYVNSPETPIFKKSKILYGFWKSKNPIRDAAEAFLVEGQMDCLMSWQAGVRNVVASSGTALTDDHLRALRRLADRILISFDSDEAGGAAGERAIDLAEAHDFRVRVITFGAWKDPAEAALKDAASFLRFVKEAEPAPEFYFRRYLPSERFDHRDHRAIGRVRIVLRKLMAIASAIERSAWVKELGARTGIEERVLLEEAERLTDGLRHESDARSNEPDARERRPERTFSRRELLSERLLAHAASAGAFSVIAECRGYFPEPYQALAALLEAGSATSGDRDLDALLERLILRAEPLDAGEIELVKEHLAREYALDRRRELALRIKHAETSGDDRMLATALRELRELPAF